MRTIRSARIPLLLMILGTAGVAIAVAASRPGSNEPRPVGQTRAFAKVSDDLLLSVGKTVPEFGGAYMDPNSGTLHVRLTEPSRALAEQVTDLLARLVHEELNSMPAVAEQARYSFAQLYRWHQAIVDVLSIEGVTYTDIDESRNRLTIGIENDQVSTRASIQEELARQDIPVEAVVIREFPAATPV